VISSSRQEGLPMNLIEAAASGRYIIATDVRGNADVVRQSGFGTLVKLNDDEAMAREIRKANNLMPERRGTESVLDYDEKYIIRVILNLYSESTQEGLGTDV
jgi:glycosyltransferase EpsD